MTQNMASVQEIQKHILGMIQDDTERKNGEITVSDALVTFNNLFAPEEPTFQIGDIHIYSFACF